MQFLGNKGINSRSSEKLGKFCQGKIFSDVKLWQLTDSQSLALKPCIRLIIHSCYYPKSYSLFSDFYSVLLLRKSKKTSLKVNLVLVLQSITGSVCKNKSENQFHHYPNNGQSISQEAFALTECWERFWLTRLYIF